MDDGHTVSDVAMRSDSVRFPSVRRPARRTCPEPDEMQRKEMAARVKAFDQKIAAWRKTKKRS